LFSRVEQIMEKKNQWRILLGTPRQRFVQLIPFLDLK
jgi:hypothetical protein